MLVYMYSMLFLFLCLHLYPEQNLVFRTTTRLVVAVGRLAEGTTAGTAVGPQDAG